MNTPMKKMIPILAFLSAIIVFSSCNFSTANISDVKMCTSIADNQCSADKPVFSTNTAEIFVSCHLNNAPNDTDVEFAWFYLGQERIPIDAVVLNSGEIIGNLKLNSSLSRPNNGWPEGDYEIVITILGTEKEPVIKSFWVK